MRFLKVLFWLLLGGLVAAFVIYNGGERVSFHLWGGLIADFSLPLLLILVFLLGLLPSIIAYQALRWRTRQRIAGLERALADLRAATATEVVVETPVVIVEQQP
ncbi:lipopolysaccharide assembly protein LapA domain-containing protein [Sphingomonas sp. M1-B02]|uniref:lipopolysaccharide assembly protein LapA domain-containing protein n=1 Tax=Sphingomonas sp. M1-B02 TaxID=3114300 RepID=UPI00223FF185|nr:lipopolysaccharide assembly protein LapA domain-containing protein [Sphingomonas sp. S6-11]UZK66905.1 LapA family protein [Sphingomonas sp. S6-11]